jgi:hypothetical protein
MKSERDVEIQREDLRQIREEYLDEREMYVQAEYSAIEGFARALLTLSGGALGFSLTYLRWAVEDPQHKGWLLAAWILFGLSLNITVAALYKSHRAFQEGRQILKKRQRAMKEDYFHNYGKPPSEHEHTEIDEENKPAEVTNSFNQLSFGFFVIGSVCLLIFTSLNLF